MDYMYRITDRSEIFWHPFRRNEVMARNLFSAHRLIHPTAFSLLVVLMLTLCWNRSIVAQENVFPGNSKEDAVHDPLANEMTSVEIKRRLDAIEKKADASRDETIRAQWIHTAQMLHMQLERLDALDNDFSSNPIEHPVDTPPFPLSYLDQLRHKHRDYQDAYTQLEKAHQAAQNRIHAADTAFNGAKQRLYTIQHEGGTVEHKELAELEYELEKESYIYARLDARLINQKLSQTSNNLERVTATIPSIEENVNFSERDYELQLQDILERENMLSNALVNTRQDLLDETRKPKDQQIHTETLESLKVLLHEALSYLHFENGVWDERRKIHLGQASTAEAVQWYRENNLMKKEISELMQVKELGQQEHAEVLIDKEILDSAITQPFNMALQKEILLRRQLAFDNLSRIMELLKDHQDDLKLMQNVRYFKFLTERFLLATNSIWDLQLAVIQDRAITVGKSVTAIFLFAVGFQIAKVIILRFLYFFLKNRRVRDGVAYTFTQLFFYLVLLVLLIGVISYAGIPLRIFAFFGGALAIAAGFGSQKIISNFLSGIILLLEGSIRVGDMVQVGESKGRVKSIGLRQTQITTFDNVDILIPNANFLEENVLNWTLESETIRSDIAVGVDFFAPVEDVMDTLVQVAQDHPEVLDDPIPEAFLENINCDNGYMRFNLYYWHAMQSPRERLLFNSALQVEIIKRLKVLGIALASPTLNIIRA
jgi:small-conductance mechanosensitive channel